MKTSQRRWSLSFIFICLSVLPVCIGVSAAQKLSRVVLDNDCRTQVLAFSSDGKILAANMTVPRKPESVVRLWDIKTGKLKKILPSNSARALALSPDGKTLVTGTGGRWAGNLKLWDVQAGKLKRHLASGYRDRDGQSRGIGPVSALAFAPNGKTLAIGMNSEGELSSGGKAVIFDIATRKVTRTLRIPGEPVSAIAFSSSGRMIAVACQDGKIRVCSVRTGKVLQTTADQGGIIGAIRFTPDKKYVVSVAENQSVKFWSVKTGRLIRTLTKVGGKYQSAPSGFAISNDTKTIAVSGDTPEVRLAYIR